MKDEDLQAFYRGERLEGGIYTAVNAWCENRDAAKDQYGPIASWKHGMFLQCPGSIQGKTNTAGGTPV